ncbi:MAG: hypothetical protein K2J67_04415 [Lachnospiraceae bacterium]|nr:hypothetical protein [Lachnospiraceae bacterium]
MSKKNLIVRGVLIGALAAYLFVPMVRAGSVKATLYTNQTKEATNPLVRDHVKDEFLLTGGVLSTSKYEVRFYYGNSAESWGNSSNEKYRLERVRVYKIDIGKTKNLTITKDMCNGNCSKVIMYGKSREEPKKKCYANAVLANY